MIDENNITPVGKFQKTHALKGELNLSLDIDSAFFSEGFPLIVNIDGTYVPFYTESIRGKGVTTSLIKLEGVDSLEEAQEFVNKTVFAEKKDMREFFGSENSELIMEDDLVGFRVVDEKLGEIGEITHIDSSTENVLFVIVLQDGEEIYVPAADDYILGIDEENREVTTDLPEELINLNRKEK